MNHLLSFLFISSVSILCHDEQQDEKYAKALKRVKFPTSQMEKYAKKGGYHKKAVDILGDKDLWKEAFQTIDEETGIFKEDIDINIVLGKFPAPAMGGWSPKEGYVVRISIDAIAQLKKQNDESSHLMSRVEMAIPHELTHVYQIYAWKQIAFMGWFKEGMACYVEQDPAKMNDYKKVSKGIPYIDAKMSERESYARGWLFFEYLEAKFGKAKAKEFMKLVCNDHKKFEDAGKEATGLDWKELREQEKEWSTEYLKNYEPKITTDKVEKKKKKQTDLKKLLKQLKDKEPSERASAVIKIMELGAAECVNDIAGLLKDDDNSVKAHAACALGFLGGKDFAKEISSLLTHEDAFVRGCAVQALGNLDAKKYSSDIEKLSTDSAKCKMYDVKEKKWVESVISDVANQVLKHWEKVKNN